MNDLRWERALAAALHVLGGASTLVVAILVGGGDPSTMLVALAGLLRVLAAGAMALGSGVGRHVCSLFDVGGLGLWTATTGGFGLVFAAPWHGFCLYAQTAPLHRRLGAGAHGDAIQRVPF